MSVGEVRSDEYNGKREIRLTMEERGIVGEEGTLRRGDRVEKGEVCREGDMLREAECLGMLVEGERGMKWWWGPEVVEGMEGLGEESSFEVGWSWGSGVHCVAEWWGGVREGDGEREGLGGGKEGGEEGLDGESAIGEGRRRVEENHILLHFGLRWGRNGR